MKTEVVSVDNEWLEIHFDSPLDMLDEKPNAQFVGRYHGEVVNIVGMNGWTDCRDLAQFNSRVKAGWPELMDGVMTRESTLKFDPGVSSGLTMQIKRRRANRDNGDVLDFEEFKRGNLDTCWSTTERVKVETKRMRAAVIEVNISANSDIRSTQMMWRTALAYLVAKKLASTGWSVEILSVATGRNVDDAQGNQSRYTATTTVAKPFNMPLSLERLALVTSPAWFRIAFFTAWLASKFIKEPHYALGYSEDMQTPYAKRMAERGYLVLRIDSNALDQKSAQATLNRITTAIKHHMS